MECNCSKIFFYKFSQELVRQIKDFKVKVKMQLQTRKELKENTKNTQENILILSNSLSKYVKNNDFIKYII